MIRLAYLPPVTGNLDDFGQLASDAERMTAVEYAWYVIESVYADSGGGTRTAETYLRMMHRALEWADRWRNF